MSDRRFIIEKVSKEWKWKYTEADGVSIESSRSYEQMEIAVSECQLFRQAMQQNKIDINNKDEKRSIDIRTDISNSDTKIDINRSNDISASQVPIEYKKEGESFEVFSSDRFSDSKLLPFRGKSHRNIMKIPEICISVSGIRGKSSTVKELENRLRNSGYQTIAKITGDDPFLIVNGVRIPINRGNNRTMQYENHRVARRFIKLSEVSDQPMATIFENQGLTEYTTRLFNEQFSCADIVFITNVRTDHADTLGNYRNVARAFARSVSSDKKVILCEQTEDTADYIDNTLNKYGADVKRVEVPREHSDFVACETVYGLNRLFEEIKGVDPMNKKEISKELLSRQPKWDIIDKTPICNIASANDTQSTDMLIKSLFNRTEYEEPFSLFVYLRGDRRSRTASFVKFANSLWDSGRIKRLFLSGNDNRVFKRRLDIPLDSIRTYSKESDPDEILESMLSYKDPIILAGNSVPDFMKDLDSEIRNRRDKVNDIRIEKPETKQSNGSFTFID